MAWLDAMFAPSDKPLNNARFELEEAYRSGDKQRIAQAKQQYDAMKLQDSGGIGALTTDKIKAAPAADIFVDPTDPNAPKTLQDAEKAGEAGRAARDARHESTKGRFPENYNDWSAGDTIRALFSDPEAYDRAREAQRKSQAGPAEEAVTAGAREASPMLANPDARGPDAYKQFLPEAPAEQPAEAAPVDPQAQMIADIKRQRAMIDAIYPQRQYDNTQQNAADQYALGARERANQLAQLAFFSGITQAAGGPWESVGRGFAAAGQAYDTGYQRYQSALQDISTRGQARSDQQYSDEASRSGAAVKLYSDQKENEIKLSKQAQEERKEQRKELIERFKAIKPDVADDPALRDEADKKRLADWERSLNASLESGQFVLIHSQ